MKLFTPVACRRSFLYDCGSANAVRIWRIEILLMAWSSSCWVTRFPLETCTVSWDCVMEHIDVHSLTSWTPCSKVRLSPSTASRYRDGNLNNTFLLPMHQRFDKFSRSLAVICRRKIYPSLLEHLFWVGISHSPKEMPEEAYWPTPTYIGLSKLLKETLHRAHEASTASTFSWLWDPELDLRLYRFLKNA